jgi:hypothetical protein
MRVEQLISKSDNNYSLYQMQLGGGLAATKMPPTASYFFS